MVRLCRFLLLLALGVALGTVDTYAQRADDADRASKNGKTEAEIDGVNVVLEYGRPNAKDREVWGKLVPYGKVWRTGANEATTISFDAPVTIEGEPLDAGTYSLFTIPNEDEWVIIFNNTAEQWGAFNYDSEQDALRVTVTPGSGEHVESMDFVADESTVKLRWLETVVPFSVAAQ
ncbi:MAG: DUF2911 domain-containing protein [Rhodothermia bacterium]|nr:DUF2911 domain-containing protein [Rhodothermia bacterium]